MSNIKTYQGYMDSILKLDHRENTKKVVINVDQELEAVISNVMTAIWRYLQ